MFGIIIVFIIVYAIFASSKNTNSDIDINSKNLVQDDVYYDYYEEEDENQGSAYESYVTYDLINGPNKH